MQSRSEPPERAAGTGTSGGREPVQRWRLVFAHAGREPSLAQREQLAAWDDALAAAALPAAGLDASRPRAKFALAAPLAAGVPGEAELADLWLVERLPRWRVREALESHLPEGHRLIDLYDVWLGEPPLPGQVAASVYRATISTPAGADAVREAATALLRAEALPRERRKGDAVVDYDLRPFLVALEVLEAPDDGVAIRMTLRHDPARGIGRPDETLAALGEALGVGQLEARSLVREALVLAEPTPPDPPPARSARRPPPSAHPGERNQSNSFAPRGPTP